MDWKCISKEQYQYSRSLISFFIAQDLGAFSEPVAIFSNVDNGLGIFGLSNNQLYVIEEVEVPNTLSGTIDGELFEPCYVVMFEDNYGPGGFTLNALDDERFLLITMSELKLGTVGSTNGDTFRIDFNNDGIGYSTSTGDGLVITALDEETGFVRGTFNGTLTEFNSSNTIEVENLVFEVTIGQ